MTDLGGERSYAAIAQSARIDQPIVIERIRNVERDPVQRNHTLHRQPNRADLIAADPDAGVLTPALAAHAEARAKIDDPGLQSAYERYDFAETYELANRIDYQLPRPVIRHVAAAFDCNDINAPRGQRFIRKQDVLTLSLPPQRDHRRMLHHNPGIGFAPLAYGLV